MEKVACYIRVSTEEQKLHGISLDAQRDKLTEYAEKNNLIIYDWYADEGISGRKLIRKRPELQRMLNDAHDRKFDRIIFIKLDRFFRSVAEYHECMKIIDPVLWTATEEKYDLTTANGRAFVNMKLTIAELEADQTGERIKLVNEYKVKNSQALVGSQSVRFGFCVDTVDGVKRVVHDKKVEAVLYELIDYYLTYQNKTQASHWLQNKHSIVKQVHQITRILSNPMLYGYYRDNPNYCEPYMNKDKFLALQEALKRNIKKPRSNKTYIFTGLIYCPVCGYRLISTCNTNVISYRCNQSIIYHLCSYNKTRSQRKLEKQLLSILDEKIKSYIVVTEIKDAKRKNNTQALKRAEQIKSEMKNLTIAFTKSRISEAEYDRAYADLERDLNDLESQLKPSGERDLTMYKELLNSDWKTLYGALNDDNKRAFWRKYVKRIDLNEKDGSIKNVLFF